MVRLDYLLMKGKSYLSSCQVGHAASDLEGPADQIQGGEAQRRLVLVVAAVIGPPVGIGRHRVAGGGGDEGAVAVQQRRVRLAVAGRVPRRRNHRRIDLEGDVAPVVDHSVGFTVQVVARPPALKETNIFLK